MTFERAASRYCDLIEEPPAAGIDAFVDSLVSVLAEVIAAATNLQPVAPSDVDLGSRPTADETRDRARGVQDALDSVDSYSTTLAPYGEDAGEVALLPLVDDLVDIWRDLKEGLIATADGKPEADVVWEWRFSFYVHWGRHATEALRALFAIQAERGGPATG